MISSVADRLRCVYCGHWVYQHEQDKHKRIDIVQLALGMLAYDEIKQTQSKISWTVSYFTDTYGYVVKLF